MFFYYSLVIGYWLLVQNSWLLVFFHFAVYQMKTLILKVSYQFVISYWSLVINSYKLITNNQWPITHKRIYAKCEINIYETNLLTPLFSLR